MIAAQAADLTVFQRTPAYSLPARNRPLRRDEIDRMKADYRAFRQAQQVSGFGVAGSPRHQVRARGHRDEERETGLRGRLGERQSGQPAHHLHRPVHQPGGERHRQEVRPPQDPRDRHRSAGGRRPVPRLPGRHQAPVPGHRLLRDLQPADNVHLVNLQRTPLVEVTEQGHPDLRAGVRVRRDRVRDRLRRDDRIADQRRHPRPGRRVAEGRVGAPVRGPTWASARPGSPTCS